MDLYCLKFYNNNVPFYYSLDCSRNFIFVKICLINRKIFFPYFFDFLNLNHREVQIANQIVAVRIATHCNLDETHEQCPNNIVNNGLHSNYAWNSLSRSRWNCPMFAAHFTNPIKYRDCGINVCFCACIVSFDEQFIDPGQAKINGLLADVCNLE